MKYESTNSVSQETLQQALQLRIVQLEEEVKKLRQTAERDDLTKCLRREAFLSILEERKRFGWLPQAMTLAVIDIDHFKKVNDTYGHLAGDEVLRTVASTIQNNIPDGSLVCRMGGEEFVLIIPGNISESEPHLEALRKKIENTLTNIDKGQQLQVTASFGATDWNTDHPLLEATAKADAALYRAKREGRNRLVLSAEEFQKAS